MNVIEEIAAERHRQVSAEGWTPEHDDAHGNGEMAQAAAVYALGAAVDHAERGVMDEFGTEGTPHRIHSLWPWGRKWHKPKSRRRDLVRAAALIVAEIERLDRAAPPASQEPCGPRWCYVCGSPAMFANGMYRCTKCDSSTVTDVRPVQPTTYSCPCGWRGGEPDRSHGLTTCPACGGDEVRMEVGNG